MSIFGYYDNINEFRKRNEKLIMVDEKKTLYEELKADTRQNLKTIWESPRFQDTFINKSNLNGKNIDMIDKLLDRTYIIFELFLDSFDRTVNPYYIQILIISCFIISIKIEAKHILKPDSIKNLYSYLSHGLPYYENILGIEKGIINKVLNNMEIDDKIHKYDDTLYGLFSEEELEKREETIVFVDNLKDSKEDIEHNFLLIWNSQEFQNNFINWKSSGLRENDMYEHNMYGKYIVECTLQLIDTVITSLGNKINSKYVFPLAIACFIISLKLIIHDWLWSNRVKHLYEFIPVFLTVRHTSSQQIKAIESDVMQRTDWKGCHVAGIYTKRRLSMGVKQKSKPKSKPKSKTKSKTKK